MINGRYTYCCDVPDCGTEVTQDYPVADGNSLMYPCVPASWIVVGFRHVCERHDQSKLTIADVLERHS